MESAANIRSQPLVAQHDTTDVFAEYGIKFTDPALLAQARTLVAKVIELADAKSTEHFEAHKALPQNPYSAQVMLDGREIPHATVVRLMPAHHFHTMVNDALGAGAEDRVDLARLTEKVIVELGAYLASHHYELAAVERHRLGQGIAAIALRDPIYVKEALAKEAAAASADAVKLRGDIGFRSTCSSTELKAARAVVDQFCNEALEKVAVYLRTTSAGGGSPFSDDSPSIDNQTSVIADKRRVQAGRYNQVQHGVPIIVGYGSDLLKRLTARVGSRATIDSNTFLAFVTLNLAERLRERPELMGALAGYTRHRDASYTEDQQFKVICSPEPPPPPAPPPTLLERIVARLTAPFAALKRAALPAPAVKALPAPSAPPAPEVVPPVTIGSHAGPK